MTSRPAAVPVARDFQLRSGRITAELSGSPGGRLVVGIPGLSANLRSFDGTLHPDTARSVAEFLGG